MDMAAENSKVCFDHQTMARAGSQAGSKSGRSETARLPPADADQADKAGNEHAAAARERGRRERSTKERRPEPIDCESRSAEVGVWIDRARKCVGSQGCVHT